MATLPSPDSEGGARVRYLTPPKGADGGQIKAFMDAFFDHESPARKSYISDLQELKLMLENKQWISQVKATPGRTPRFKLQPDESTEDIPKPVTNELRPIFDNEVARLKNRRSKPRVRATPAAADDAAVGAARADDVLESHLQDIGWTRIRNRTIDRMVAFGTGIFKSYLDRNWMDTVRIGATGVYRCLNNACGFMSAGMEITPEQVLGLPPEKVGFLQKTDTFSESAMEMKTTYKMDKCLDCGAPMNEYAPGPEEAEGEDLFGRPLGQMVPKNQPTIEAVSPYDIFFQNEGIEVTPESLMDVGGQIGQETPRSLEWIAARYGLKAQGNDYYTRDGNRVVPDDPVIIAERHPISGDVGSDSRGSSSASTRNLYRNHCLVREFYEQPTMRYPEGRAIHMAGRVCVMDEDLLEEPKADPDDPEKDMSAKIPRVRYSLSRFWEKEGEILGEGLLAPLLSPQRRINMMWSQIIATRERCGVQGILKMKGTKLSSPGAMRGYPGYVVDWEPGEFGPEMGKPEPFPAQMMDSRVYEEADRTVDRMLAIAGMQDVDAGKAPRNISAATAIKLLLDQSSERRGPRIEEYTEAEKAVWQHQLLLLREYAREPRPYKKLSKTTGKWETLKFIGRDLTDQTDISVEEEPGYDEVAYERENVIQGLQLGIIQPATPYSRYVIAEALGLPAKAIEENSVQIEDALRRWYLFRDSGTVPSVDETEDDHATFWQIYGKEFKGEDGLRFKAECGWDAILKLIAGWEEKLTMREQAAQAIKLMQQQIQAGQQTMMVPGLEQAMALPPLPPAMEDKVFMVWTEMVGAAQQAQMQQAAMTGMAPPPPPFNIQHPFVKMKAVAEAHRMYDQKRMQAAQMTPTAAAPGAAATAAGTEPTPGGAPAEAPVA